MNLRGNEQHVDDENNLWPLQVEMGSQPMLFDWEALAGLSEASQTNFWANPSNLEMDNTENHQQAGGDIATAAFTAINPSGSLGASETPELTQPYYYNCPLCEMVFLRLEHQVRHTRTVHLSKRPQVEGPVPLQTTESFAFPCQDTPSTAAASFGIGPSFTNLFSDPAMPPPSQVDFDGLENFEPLTYSNYFSSADLGQYSNHSPLASPRGSPTSGSGVLSERQVSPVSYGSGVSGESYPPRSGRKGKKSANMSYSKIVKKAPKPHKPKTERFGRRRGPVTEDQRIKSREIRRLRYCLRCKLLKRTCDGNIPCEGCQSQGSRSRPLVPCTRLQVKDLGYFLKDWKVDYEQQALSSFSIFDIQGFSPNETVMWVTHGYGLVLPVMVREVFLRSNSSPSGNQTLPIKHGQESMRSKALSNKLAVGSAGVSTAALQEYLDKHIDVSFQTFIDSAFTGAPFVTEVLQTMHGFCSANGSTSVRKALKLVLAYRLTTSATLMDKNSFVGETIQDAEENDLLDASPPAAPTMVDSSIKSSLADMWRELHKEVLEELSKLHEGVYTGEKRFKNWFLILMLSLVLLITWEQIQYDCHCRASDPALAAKFCEDMNAVPLGVVNGLYQSMSQYIPEIKAWSDEEELYLPEMDVYGSIAMKQMQQHVLKYEAYLLTRKDAKFDRDNPHCLSNKFLSQIVLRDNWGSHAEAGAPA